jgi:AraC-like DNA-binding protein
VRRAIVAVEGAGGDIDVGSLSARVAASPRQLTRLFRDCMGMGPKRFGRIVQAALRRLVQGETPLAELAADLGYADQAHLTRELRQLFGVAPARLARQIRPSERGDATYLELATAARSEAS